MTDLTDRMRTCAAYIMERPRGEPMPTDRAELDEVLARIELVLDDAAVLLIEASDLLEATPAPLGEPMPILEPVTLPTPPSLWVAPGGPLPGIQSGTVSPRACPRCDSRAMKTLRRREGRMMLECPACTHTWEMTTR
jgi:hypothetical protein